MSDQQARPQPKATDALLCFRGAFRRLILPTAMSRRHRTKGQGARLSKQVCRCPLRIAPGSAVQGLAVTRRPQLDRTRVVGQILVLALAPAPRSAPQSAARGASARRSDGIGLCERPFSAIAPPAFLRCSRGHAADLGRHLERLGPASNKPPPHDPGSSRLRQWPPPRRRRPCG